jgi:hypothetical protein
MLNRRLIGPDDIFSGTGLTNRSRSLSDCGQAFANTTIPFSRSVVSIHRHPNCHRRSEKVGSEGLRAPAWPSKIAKRLLFIVAVVGVPGKGPGKLDDRLSLS